MRTSKEPCRAGIVSMGCAQKRLSRTARHCVGRLLRAGVALVSVLTPHSLLGSNGVFSHYEVTVGAAVRKDCSQQWTWSRREATLPAVVRLENDEADCPDHFGITGVVITLDCPERTPEIDRLEVDEFRSRYFLKTNMRATLKVTGGYATTSHDEDQFNHETAHSETYATIGGTLAPDFWDFGQQSVYGGPMPAGYYPVALTEECIWNRITYYKRPEDGKDMAKLQGWAYFLLADDSLPMGLCAELRVDIVVHYMVSSAAPILTGIDQKIAVPGTSQRITIRGENLPESPNLEFLGAGLGNVDGALALSAVNRTSGNQIEALLTVGPEAGLGSRRLKLTAGTQTAMLEQAISVVGIELQVNQGAKTAPDSVHVANHATVIRAFPRTTVELGPMKGLLYVFDGEAQLPGSPFHPGAPPPNVGSDGSAPLQASTRLSPSFTPSDRLFLRDSLNFYFGRGQSWAPELKPGVYVFQLAISSSDPARLPPELPGLMRTDLASRTDFLVCPALPGQTFRTSPPLRLLVLRDNPSVGGVRPRREALRAAIDYIAAAFPVDRTQFAWTPYDVKPEFLNVVGLRPTPGEDTKQDWSTRLLAQLASLLRGVNDRLGPSMAFHQIAFVTDAIRAQQICGEEILGESDKSTSFISSSLPTTFAHEFGHCLGFGDTYCGKLCDAWFYSRTDCYAVKLNCRRADAIPAGNLVEDGAVRLVPVYRGLTSAPVPVLSVTASVAAPDRARPSPVYYVDFVYQRVDLMGRANDENLRWPDLVEWKHMQTKLQVPPRRMKMEEEEHLVLRGVICIDDSVELMELAREVEGIASEALPPGDYVLELIDAVGVVRSSRSFGIDPRISGGGIGTAVSFAASTRWCAEAVRVQLRRGTNVLWSRSLSAGRPSVTLLEPAGGPLSGDPTMIRWTTSDADGDPVTCAVYYIRDDGSPVPIARGHRETSLEWDPSGAPGCSHGHILVVASDGWNEGEGWSAPFTLPDQAPEVALLAPVEGSAVSVGETVTLVGSGYDPEDGWLPAEQLSFRSDLEGDLGTGDTISRVLQEGLHRLTVRGVDRTGNVSEESVEFLVGPAGRVPVVESLSPDLGPAGVAVTITGRDFDPADTRVFFAQTEAEVVSVTSSECVAQVPGDLPPGACQVSLLAYGVTTMPVRFTMLAGHPRVLSVAPRGGPAGTPVWLSLAEIEPGSDVLVLFAGAPAAVLESGGEGAVALVPQGLNPGSVPLVVSTPQGSSDPVTFQITTGEPVSWVHLNSVWPPSGTAGTMVALRGSWWASNATDTVVHFGDLVVPPVDVAGELLHALVPDAETAGPVRLWVSVRGCPSTAVPFSLEVGERCMGPPLGVVGWWAAEGDAQDVLGTFPGELRNGAGFGPGKVGSGFFLDGTDDYVQVGSSAALALNDVLTLEAWIAPAGPGSGGVEGGVLVHKEGEYGLARFADGTLRWSVANTVPGWGWVDTGAVAPLGQWTHVAWVYDRGAVRTYVNGQLTQDYAGDGAVGDASPGLDDLRIGGRQQADQSFQGTIDEVTLYARALSALEIGAVYAADSAGKCIPSGSEPPEISISAVAGGLALTWPAGPSEFMLEATDDLAAPAGWVQVMEPSVPAGDLMRVIVHPDVGQQFFRLRARASGAP